MVVPSLACGPPRGCEPRRACEPPRGLEPPPERRASRPRIESRPRDPEARSLLPAGRGDGADLSARARARLRSAESAPGGTTASGAPAGARPRARSGERPRRPADLEPLDACCREPAEADRRPSEREPIGEACRRRAEPDPAAGLRDLNLSRGGFRRPAPVALLVRLFMGGNSNTRQAVRHSAGGSMIVGASGALTHTPARLRFRWEVPRRRDQPPRADTPDGDQR